MSDFITHVAAIVLGVLVTLLLARGYNNATSFPAVSSKKRATVTATAKGNTDNYNNNQKKKNRNKKNKKKPAAAGAVAAEDDDEEDGDGDSDVDDPTAFAEAELDVFEEEDKKKKKASQQRKKKNKENNNDAANGNSSAVPVAVDAITPVATKSKPFVPTSYVPPREAQSMVLTTEQSDYIDTTWKLAGYPKSHFFTVGFNLWIAKQEDAAVDAFQRGANNVGCVPCMYFYVNMQHKRGNFYLLLPYAFEGAIRGHKHCMDHLIVCYDMSKPAMAVALMSFWIKMLVELELVDTTHREKERKEMKKNIANICCVCEEIDTAEKTFEKCGICKYYSYCGNNCQTRHWQEQNHIGECRHLQILKEYCKPRYVRKIREAIINGDDPKDIPRLQNLRTALGLNRPKEEYEELLSRLGDDNDSAIQDRYNYLTARKDGTVHIGSTPEEM